jgi:hypothetical protein
VAEGDLRLRQQRPWSDVTLHDAVTDITDDAVCD